MAYRKVARAEEIPSGRTHFVRAEGKAVILANRGGRIYALDGVCPHQHNPLEGAVLWDCLLDCPWHHFQYDIRTGENLYPKNVYPEDMPRLEAQVLSLRTFPVQVKEDEVWVDLG